MALVFTGSVSIFFFSKFVILGDGNFFICKIYLKKFSNDNHQTYTSSIKLIKWRCIDGHYLIDSYQTAHQ